MKILGIDPGYGRIGFGVISATGNRFSHVVHGVIETTKKKELPFRLNEIYESINKIIDEYEPDEVSIEKLFFFKNVTTAMAVSEARGVIQLAAYQKGLPIFEYNPFEIKMAVTGNGRAEKGQVQRVLKMFLGLSGTPKPDDAADGLAAALCHLNSRNHLR
ncbi:MAG TPA: crossover junction endodeoxyribonuclease RuvC [Thermotogota bacterium]|nr:crossover junction endodeoxyribonuclease RuvC [Thermotogota bacterium]HPJ88192.1 crossover junction endodeoxyribonuclease RuvC [Thermotogota bacterium]HPR95625.1 crossover junction endodeoxyribonuclease RuvC [Thermotogota bacterium]